VKDRGGGEKMAQGDKGRPNPFIKAAVDLWEEGEWDDRLLWGLLCWEILFSTLGLPKRNFAFALHANRESSRAGS
jgi:hypothetical protein